MNHKHLRRNTSESVSELRELDSIAKSDKTNLFNATHVLNHLDDTDPTGQGASHIRSTVAKIPQWSLARIPIDDVVNHFDSDAETPMIGNNYGESDESVAQQYARKNTRPPHLILNNHNNGGFYTLDGAHRLRAAKLRGDTHVYAYIPASIAKSESLNKVKIQESIAGQPGKIKLLDGKNKGQVVEANPDSRDPNNLKIRPLTGNNLKVQNSNGKDVNLQSGGQANWDKDRTHKIISKPTPRIHGHHILEAEDVHPFMVHTKKQAQLHHGVDLTKIRPHEDNEGSTGSHTVSGVGTNAAGKKVIVKGRLPNDLTKPFDLKNAEDDFMLGPHYEELTTAQREGLYHNAAHVLGLGKYVPLTSVVEDNKDSGRHGPNGNHYSIMEKIPNAEHFDRDNKHHIDTLQDMNKSGELDKLTLMNTLLGNTDRHGGNFMMSPKGLHLIDHGLTFDFHNQSGRNIMRPRYYDHVHPSEDDTVHPEAVEWLKNINPENMKSFFKKHQVHQDFSRPIMKALLHAQDVVKSNKGAISMEDLRNHITDTYKNFPYQGTRFGPKKPTMMGGKK